MSTIKNPTRFAELEYCLQGYFDGKLALVMKQVRDDLTHKQLEERGRYQSSLAGVLASANPYADNTGSFWACTLQTESNIMPKQNIHVLILKCFYIIMVY
jgi:hypothetical protein